MTNKYFKNFTDEKFNKNNNYKIIIDRTSKQKIQFNSVFKYGIVAICALFVIGGTIKISTNYKIGNSSDENLPNNPIIISQQDIIKINKSGYQFSTDMDYDGKWQDANLEDEFSFINKLSIPETFKERQRKGKIYVRDENNNYTLLRQYSIMYSPKDLHGVIEIDFSTDMPIGYIHDKFWGESDIEKSIINNIPMEIHVYENPEDNTKITGYAVFEYQGYKFVVNSYLITQDEFIEVLKSVVK